MTRSLAAQFWYQEVRTGVNLMTDLIDSLRELFGCSRSSHYSLTTRRIFSNAAPSLRERLRAKSARAKAGYAPAASHATSDAVFLGERAGALRRKCLRGL